MKPRHAKAPLGRVAIASAIACFVLGSPCLAATVVWTNATANNAWSTNDNWDPVGEPTATSNVVFPAGLAATITTTTTENALSLTFEDDYTLSGGTLTLASGNSISTADGVTVSILNTLTITGGLTKTGPGTLVLGGNNTNAGGTVIQQGTIRAQNVGAMGGTGVLTTVNDGATLEIAASITLDRPVLMKQGATLAGVGTAGSNGVMTIDPASTIVHLATGDAGDLFTLGNGANDLTGGAATSVIQPLGPGTIRLAFASNYAGSWLLDQGRLELGVATALGNNPDQSLTLAGGTLSARVNSATSFTGSPGNQISLTADSTILSDRTSAGGGIAYTFGSLGMGSQTLTIAPGPSSTSGTAGITFGSVVLSGNPNFHIANTGATGRLTLNSLDGGASPRVITKTGPGELVINGGATNLASGSSWVISGGSLLDLVFPDLGSDSVIPVSETQNPLGDAELSFTNGTLRLQANGANNNTVQTYQLPSAMTLAGEVVLNPGRRTGSGTNKTYELNELTLADGTVLSMSGDSGHGIRLTGPLALQGDAVLSGVNVTNRSSLLTLNGGITGGAGDSVEIRGGTSPINLTINAASTYGGGTAITGGNVTLNAANALGTGPVSVTGGSLRVNGPELLAENTVLLNGGALDLRNNTTTDFSTSELTVSGNSTLTVGNNGSGTSQVITLPDLNVSGTTNLTFTNANSFLPLISNLSLGGDLTFTNNVAARVGTITEDGTPRMLRKAGTNTLTLEGASNHSGGTEVLAGTLALSHQDALGSGLLTLGDTSGASTATVSAIAGLTIPNDLLVRAGSSGAQTLSATGGNLTWAGNVELERLLTLSNTSSSLSSTLSGQITGPGTLAKTGVGEWILANLANDFGGGDSDAIAINQGTLTVTNDAALGNLANGITLTATGSFRSNGSFATQRAFTFSGTTTGIDVTAGQTLTLDSPLAGTGAFNKSGPGILEIGPGVDSSATRGAAASTSVTAGTLRLQGPKNLGDATPLSASTGATVELQADADTDFAHSFTISGNATVMVDRAVGGSGSDGRHQLGAVNIPSGNTLTVTGANGYGLSLQSATLQFSPGLTNESAAPLRIGELIANPANSSRTLTVGGVGDAEIVGAMFKASGTGDYGITKNGPGTFRFGTSVSDFNGALLVRDGVVDLNGLNHSVGLVTLGGAVSAEGAKIVTGAAGSLTLTNGLTFNATGPAPDTTIIGNVVLAPVNHTFSVPNSNAAAVEVTIDGTLTGSPGSALTKTSTGILRLAGAGNNAPGPVTVNGGVLELAKTGGAQALGTDALTLNGSTVRLLASEQIPDTTPVSIGTNSNTTFDLNGFTETLGGATLTQSATGNASILATGADGTLVLAGNLVFNNNGNSSSSIARNILITGTGTRGTAANNGTLDLGGATRTIHVDTTTVGANAANANATIETRIINGGILKTGPRTLILTHPENSIPGGVQIAEGTVRFTSLGALGGGPITFAQSGSGSASLEFATVSGTFEDDLTLTGSGLGSISLVYSGIAPNVLTLSGNIDMQNDLSVDVVNGFLNDDKGALLDLTGTLDDGAGTSSLTKFGEGILRLAVGNTYSGPTTVRRGVLSIPSDDALGDTDATLTLDGGLLHATASMTSPRDLVFGPDGGGLRVDSPGVLEFTGGVDWGTGNTSFHGSGMTILSGESTGAGGNMLIGGPMNFARFVTGDPYPTDHVLSLRGNVKLPAGNIEINRRGMILLGNEDFIRPLGTGPGTFQMPTTTVVGWAAHGADRVVNIDGDDPIVWGQATPRFLSFSGSNTIGGLALGHASATHTVDFQSHIELNSSSTNSTRLIEIGNGAAEVDAVLSGGFSNTPNPTARFRALQFHGDGSSEISGPLSGSISVTKNGTGTMTLSGDNSGFTGTLFANLGTLVIASESSVGSARSIGMWEDGVVDVTGLSGPLTFADPENSYMYIYGTFIGSAISPGYFYGYGAVTGDLTMPADSYFDPGFSNTLHIGGDLVIEENAKYDLTVYGYEGLVPNDDFNRIRVTGTVTLEGEIDLYAYDLEDHVGETIVFILNDGDDPVQGHFAGLPEGAVINIGDGLALQITYQANGDGGSVANDVGFTVIEAAIGPDVAVTIDAPANVSPGTEFSVTVTVSNSGPGDADGLGVRIDLPFNASFISSDPAGDLTSGEGGDQLFIDLDGLPELAASVITLTFTAPAEPDVISISATLEGDDADANPVDNSAQASIQVAAPGGVVELDSYSFDFNAGTGELEIQTVIGKDYVLQRSRDLVAWDDLDTYVGDGDLLIIPLVLDEAPEFFRVKVIDSETASS